MSRKLKAVMVFCALALAALGACSSGSSTDPTPVDPKDRYVGGKWLTRDVTGSGDGWDVVFKDNNTFDGFLPGATTVKITGPYAVDAAGKVTGTFVATSGGRVGRIEASLESNDTILKFDFIETNAFDNPENVNGVVVLECRGPNPTKGSTGGQVGTGNSADAIPATSVVWAYKDVTGWPVTADLKSATVTLGSPAPTICWDRSYPATWPKDPNAGKIDASMWVIGKVGGQWYGSVWEGVVPGASQCSTTEALAGQPPFIQAGTAPINGWYPQHGEQVGFMVSTIARGGTPSNSPNERSQIVLVAWP